MGQEIEGGMQVDKQVGDGTIYLYMKKAPETFNLSGTVNPSKLCTNISDHHLCSSKKDRIFICGFNN